MVINKGVLFLIRWPVFLVVLCCSSTLVLGKEVSVRADHYMAGVRAYFGRDGVKKDLESAYKEFLIASEMGMPEAHFNLGDMYRLGEYVEVNTKKAEALFLLAAEGYITQAMHALGVFYDKGAENVSVDLNKAIYWYTKAAEEGDSESMAALGNLHASGRLEKNYMGAYFWLYQATMHGKTDRHKGLMDALWESFSEEQKLAVSNIIKQVNGEFKP